MSGFRIVLALLLLGQIEVKAKNYQGLTYFDAWTTVVTYFSEQTGEKNSYWLTGAEEYMETEDQRGEDKRSRESHYLSFTIKETNCLTTENITPIMCAFKNNGFDTTRLDELPGLFNSNS
ncbi:cathelicidin-1-like [Macrotis lagotis]|uniref:cathelicidin-1-like n=1 Tax=Macrotis lagotis TaxID=92651 RepID=UPI003D682F58